MLRRVVVTGFGMVSPLACGAQETWKRLIAGESGIREITQFDVSDLPSKIAGTVPTIIQESSDFFDPDKFVDPVEQRRMDKFIIFSLAAVQEALDMASWHPNSPEEQERSGVSFGAGIGGLPKIYENSVALFENGARRVSPFFIPSALINLAAGHISIRHQLKGPNHATVTACASGSHAIGDAARMIIFGDADVMVAGGAESTVFRFGVAGFSALRALSTHYNETPSKASRPWDKGRDGFVIAEGAGALVLEEYEHAVSRGATIFAEIVGYGMSSDAHHMTAPSPSGDGAYRAMKAALHQAQIRPEEIGYINAHGTATIPGDIAEAQAVSKLYGEYARNGLCVSSTKSATGHLLGGAGAVEAIFCIQALRNGVLPPTLNLEDPDNEFGLDFVPLTAREKEIKFAISNSFGFGGTNASLVFKKL
ncbi:MAG: beta-ketoacyl-ACP synthase II [Holosporales bacterium]|nr:beta-ketoacyl-ACP synthase II [Holosporales bacterium]